MEFQETKLDNGLSITAEINPNAASMAAGFFVRTGSRDESNEISGVSHFLEHMMFKGTNRRSAFDVNREFDHMGANYNAFTSEENTVYYGAVLPEFQTPLLDLLCDLMRPALREEDFNLEKNVILEEIALYQDMPHFRVYEELMTQHFSPHPLGNSILGTNESIQGLQLQKMCEYFRHRYSPGNLILVGVGRLDFDAFVDKASQMCLSWQAYDVSRKTSQVEASVVTKTLHDPRITREHIGLMSMAPSQQSEQRYAAELLACILGDATGSRLYYALIEPAIADEASTSFSPMDKSGGFLTFLSTNSDRASEALKIVQRELDKLMDSCPNDQELQAAKNKIASGATLKGELPMGRLSSVGFDWVYRKQYLPLKEQIERLFAVTPQDLLEVARQYNLAQSTVVALGPLEKL